MSFDISKVYVCTKGNDTFEKGDRVAVDKRDGALVSFEGLGWIEAADVENAVKGAEFVEDTKYSPLYVGSSLSITKK